MLDKLNRRLADRERPLLLRLERLELDAPLLKAIEEGARIKAIYDELPLEQILILDVLTDEHPKLRFLLTHGVILVVPGPYMQTPMI